MSSILFPLVCSALCAFSLGAIDAEAQLRASEAPAARADAIVAPWVSDRAPGVSVAVSLNDEIVYARGAGLANLEHGVPLSPDSVFQVASVSKQFTAFAVFLLVSEGQIQLGDDIRTYLPELGETDDVVTVQHLLDHAGGLREQNTLAAMAGWMPGDIHTRDGIFDLVARQRGVNFPAASRIEYSNTGYALLARVVERVSGQPFREFMQENVFAPLGMTRSGFPADRDALVTQRAASYYPAGESFRNVISASESIGSSGLYTTALDVLRWAENFETGVVGSSRVFELMAARYTAENGEVSTFGRGQELRVHNGFATWSHGGRDAGYRSFLLRVPAADLEIVILSNRTDFDTAAMAFALMDAWLENDPRYVGPQADNWEPHSLNDLQGLAGDYEFYPGVIFSLRAGEGGLTFAPHGASRDDLAPLVQIGPGEFRLSRSPDLSLVFEAQRGTPAARMGYRIGLHGILWAPRIALESFQPESLDINEFAGRCFSEELETHYRLEARDGVLIAHHPRLQSFEFTPYQPDTFAGEGPLQRIEFVRAQSGQPVGFHASGPLAMNVWFECRAG